jgi:hypothetical protein
VILHETDRTVDAVGAACSAEPNPSPCAPTFFRLIDD